MSQSGDRVIRRSGDLGTTSVPEQLCPKCGYLMEATTPLDGGALPKDGDVSICLNCGAILIFTAELKMRAATDQEVAEIMRDKQTASMIQRAQSYIRRRGPIEKGAAQQ